MKEHKYRQQIDTIGCTQEKFNNQGFGIKFLLLRVKF